VTEIVELRQYTLCPGQRDVLIELFDREFVESQEATGATILGQFRDLDNPDRFVWLRGFGGHGARLRSLTDFYGGPVWKAHAQAANATMIDVDNVLLLRARSGIPVAAVRPSRAATRPPSSAVLATIYYRDRPFDEAFARFFDCEIRPAARKTGAEPIACLQTEYAENTFPALPVREGEHAFVWLARFDSVTDLDRHLAEMVDVGTTEHLRLTPTARSLIR
jgi:hypothetical protein